MVASNSHTTHSLQDYAYAAKTKVNDLLGRGGLQNNAKIQQLQDQTQDVLRNIASFDSEIPRAAMTFPEAAGAQNKKYEKSVSSYFYIGLVLGCIDADLCKYILNIHCSAFFETQDVQSFAPLYSQQIRICFRQGLMTFSANFADIGISCVSRQIRRVSNIFQ